MKYVHFISKQNYTAFQFAVHILTITICLIFAVSCRINYLVYRSVSRGHQVGKITGAQVIETS